MDLGLEGKTAIVCASSRGLGKACASALAREGVRIVVNGTDKARTEQTAAEIGTFAAERPLAVAADITTPEGRHALLAACPKPDILVNNAGGPPMGNFRQWTRSDWIKALDLNLLGAVEMIRAILDGMVERRFGRIVNITSVAVKAPIPDLDLSNASRSALTGFVGGLARQVSRYNVTMNNILPGSFDTDRLASAASRQASANAVALEDQLRAMGEREVSGRFGSPEELGSLCAFLCASGSGYLTRQNILIDGGTYPGIV
ncbi:SDR family oxidoreductase [Allomesorhizobium alhagi]|uniref:Short-chain dehydrogenase/reductase SDR n=1 Tax=Mesorhizobium alhagi CCNWXJ12-2 TaxID=1107882 RepID=H0HWS9_9HYPH|nr:SDR family oxidoreductase [Mesorhizobium alhagi]EHK54822.1 short-chain dehydrogenase/reductase SDR [Mesorhizobium alhagi CCNWXJ12-2]